MNLAVGIYDMSGKAVIYRDEFLRDLQFHRCLSDHTVSAYRRDLRLYGEFLKSQKTRNKDLKAFYRFLTQRGLSARSQARIVSSLRTYFHFLEARGLKKESEQIKHLKFPHFQQKLPKSLSFKEFQKLLSACEVKNKDLSSRNRLVLILLYGLGCRVSELTGLNLKDFNETESWIRVTGKGRKQRLLPLSPPVYRALRDYLKNNRPLIAKGSTTALICNSRGRRPSRVDIWRWLKSWSGKAGFSEVKNPHSFRHGCATALLEEGADLISIQKLLGHLNVTTTQIYTAVSSKHLKETIREHHPLSDPKKGA